MRGPLAWALAHGDWLLVAAALIGALGWGWIRFGARIFSREATYRMARPFPLVGRPDLVMQEWGGALVVHDLKTRKSDRIFPSDKLQLALYALLLRQSTGRRVARHAIVRVATPNATRLARVALDMEDESLTNLYEAFCAKAALPLSANMTAAPHLCRQCGFRGRGCPGKQFTSR